MLSAKGMISIEKGRGIFVRGASTENVTDPLRHFLQMKTGNNYVQDVVELRLIIEPSIAERAAVHRTQDDIRHLSKTIEEMQYYEGDAPGLAHIDMSFHLGIAKATQNSIVEIILDPIHKLMPEIKTKIISSVPESRDSAIIWHRKILDAIIAKDSNLAFETMKKHLEIAHEHVRKMLERSSFPLRS